MYTDSSSSRSIGRACTVALVSAFQEPVPWMVEGHMCGHYQYTHPGKDHLQLWLFFYSYQSLYSSVSADHHYEDMIGCHHDSILKHTSHLYILGLWYPVFYRGFWYWYVFVMGRFEGRALSKDVSDVIDMGCSTLCWLNLTWYDCRLSAMLSITPELGGTPLGCGMVGCWQIKSVLANIGCENSIRI